MTQDHTTIDDRPNQQEQRRNLSVFEDPDVRSFSGTADNSGRASESARKSRILLAISVQPTDAMLAEIAADRQPRRDYIALRQELGADVMYPNDAQTVLMGRLIRRLFGARIVVAWGAYRHRKAYDYIYSDTEQVGLPLAMLLKLSRTPRTTPPCTNVTMPHAFQKEAIF